MKNFNIGENIGFGLDRVLNNLVFFVFVFLSIFILMMGFSYVDPSSLPFFIAFTSNVILFIIYLLLSLVFFIGLYKIALSLTTKEKVEIKETDDLLPVFPKFVLTVFTYNLIIFLGLICFIIPGIIFLIKYQFAPFIVLNEKNVGIRESFKKSSSLTSSLCWKLFFFELILGFVNFTGLLCFGLGLLITLPTTIVARAKIYKELKSKGSAFYGKSLTK